MAVKPEPGRDPQMVERTQKLNVAFALSSVGLLLAMAAMVFFDYDREWKRYQAEFTRLEASQTRAQLESAASGVDATKLQQVQAQLEQGRQQAAANAAAIRQASAEIEKLGSEWYATDQDYRFTKARIDVARYELDEAVHRGLASREARGRHLEELETEWARLRTALEDVLARREAARARHAELQKTKLEAERARKELLAAQTRLQGRLDDLKQGFVFRVRNLPILDQFNPSLKVNQIMPANLFDDVSFTGTPKVDRCTTCHLGIDKKGYETAPQPFTSHPNIELYLRGGHPIERIGCTACHQGRGRATGFHSAAHTASSKEQEQAWGRHIGKARYEALHYWDLPMLAKGHTESQCAKCHRGVAEVPKAEQLNAGIFLIERYGCNGCHKIKGWEGLRKVGPDLTRITSKTSEEWIYRWVKEPKAFRRTRMPQIWDVRVGETEEQKARNDVEINAVTAYVVEHSARESYPEPPKGELEAGRRAFESVGCLACHRVGQDERGLAGLEMASYRSHGPNLEGSGSKLDAGWLYAWIRNPKGYWHETKMPSLRLSEQEAADVTAYLMSLKNEAFAARPRPALDASLRDAIAREYLLAQLTVKQADERLAAMGERERTLFVGERTIGRYGCFGCHTIAGFEKASPIGVELTEEGSKLVERLDFGFEGGKIAHTLPAWFERKLLEPRVFDKDKAKAPADLLRMPKFFFDEQEADAIVTAILSFSKEQVPLAAQRQLGAEDRFVQKGWRLVRDLNCQGCHKIGEKGGSIQAVVADQLEKSGGEVMQASALSPPLLFNAVSKVGEGARVQTPWLHDFLKDPSNRIRPWLSLRMPTFELDDEQANTLTHYFAAMDGVAYPYEPKPSVTAADAAAGRDLFTRWQCVKCHVVAGRLPQQDPANMAPDLALVPARLRADWLSLWLADPGRILPGTRMPTNFPASPEENAFPEILGGDQQRQIQAVRSYLLTLGAGRPHLAQAPRPRAAEEMP